MITEAYSYRELLRSALLYIEMKTLTEGFDTCIYMYIPNHIVQIFVALPIKINITENHNL